MTNSTTRICVWSGPRNISTALMYSFAQRQDTKVFDEPLYAYYLKNHPKASEYHPGTGAIVSTMETNGQKVIEMMMDPHDKPVVFFKGMTHHLLDLDRSFMKDVVNIILTRNPFEMLPSFAKVIEHPSMADVGYALHLELLEDLQKMNAKTIVLDSKKVLLNPKGVLTRLCDDIGIPFDESMLHWEPSARTEDGIWAKYWYDSVHKSSGFMKYVPKTDPFPKYLEPLLKKCRPCYEKLMELSI